MGWFGWFVCVLLSLHIYIAIYLFALRWNEITHLFKCQPNIAYPMLFLFLIVFVNCNVSKIVPDRELFGIDEVYSTYIRVFLQELLLVVLLVQFKFLIDPLPTQKANSLKEKTILITGGSSGIGLGAAKQLTALGANVIITSRTKESGECAIRQVEEYLKDKKKESQHCGRIEYLILNFNSFENIKLFHQQITEKYSNIDILVNNAGFFPSRLVISPPPFESGFGEMHLGHFYLTGLLLPLLTNNQRKAKIITTSSVAHHWAKESLLNEFYGKEVKDGWDSYSRAKLLNVIFMRELAKRQKNNNLYCFSFHPGVVRTNITRYLNENIFKKYLRLVVNLFSIVILRNTFEGSADIPYLAVYDDENFLNKNNGKYFFTMTPVDVNPIINDKLSERMWNLSVDSIAQFDPSFPKLLEEYLHL